MPLLPSTLTLTGALLIRHFAKASPYRRVRVGCRIYSSVKVFSNLCSSWVSVFGVKGFFFNFDSYVIFSFWLSTSLSHSPILCVTEILIEDEYDSFVKFHRLFLKSWYWVQFKDLRVQRRGSWTIGWSIRRTVHVL